MFFTETMGRFDKYFVDLKGLKADSLKMNFDLDNAFFGDIEGEEFQRGTVKADVTVKKRRDIFELTFSMQGTVTVPCDRCLDDLDVSVETENLIKVKLGDNYADDGDIVIVPETDGGVNIAWYLYEFIVLALPMKRVHAPGKCNHEMTGRLKRHGYSDGDSADETDTLDRAVDPRWESLKNIQIEEDN